MALVANLNSYVTVAEADAYLANSVRAADAWGFLSTTDKERALASATRMLQRQTWLGDKATGLNNVATVALAAGGSGHAVGDILTISGGTGVSATAKVATLSGSAVATVTLLDGGLYSVNPTASGVATTSSGAGTGATLNLTFATQALAFPRSGLTDKEGETVSATTVPQAVKDATCELAYEVSQNSDLETSRSQDDNTKRLKAGSVELENFRPQLNQGRFPFPVTELISLFLAASSALAGPTASDAGVGTTSFQDEDGKPPYGLSASFDG